MLLGNTAKSTHMTLDLVPEILNSVDMICLVSELFGMIEAKMFEVRYIEHIIPTPAIRSCHMAFFWFGLNTKEQCPDNRAKSARPPEKYWFPKYA